MNNIPLEQWKRWELYAGDEVHYTFYVGSREKIDITVHMDAKHLHEVSVRFYEWERITSITELRNYTEELAKGVSKAEEEVTSRPRGNIV